MTRWIIGWCSITLALAIAGCASEPAAPVEPAPQAAPAEPAPAPAPAPAPEPVREPTAEELPVAEDYEAEAREQITAKNVTAELDTLEKEIGTP